MLVFNFQPLEFLNNLNQERWRERDLFYYLLQRSNMAYGTKSAGFTLLFLEVKYDLWDQK